MSCSALRICRISIHRIYKFQIVAITTTLQISVWSLLVCSFFYSFFVSFHSDGWCCCCCRCLSVSIFIAPFSSFFHSIVWPKSLINYKLSTTQPCDQQRCPEQWILLSVNFNQKIGVFGELKSHWINIELSWQSNWILTFRTKVNENDKPTRSLIQHIVFVHVCLYVPVPVLITIFNSSQIENFLHSFFLCTCVYLCKLVHILTNSLFQVNERNNKSNLKYFMLKYLCSDIELFKCLIWNSCCICKFVSS